MRENITEEKQKTKLRRSRLRKYSNHTKDQIYIYNETEIGFIHRASKAVCVFAMNEVSILVNSLNFSCLEREASWPMLAERV